MSRKKYILSQFQKPGVTGVWWHEKDPGPLSTIPFISQFGHMKFTKINLDKNMKPHLNDGIEFHYVEGGKYQWEFQGRKVELLPDDLSITAPWHLNGSPSGKMDLGEINWLIIKPEQFSVNAPLRLGNWTKLPKSLQTNIGLTICSQNGIVLKKVPKFKKYFLDLRSELSEQREGYKMVVVNILENMFIALERHFESKKLQIEQQDSFLKTLNRTIQSELSQKWVVEQLAEQFGMGKTKFTEEVKRLTGYPPNSYIINLKISRAESLLKERVHVNLADIAYECGFSSLQHFTSTFSQRTGFTPALYRRKYKSVS